MRLHRFLLKEKIGDSRGVTVTDPDMIHQWRDVFRFTTGTQLILFDNSGFEYSGLIERISYMGATVKILSQEDKSKVSSPEVTLYAALIKKDNFEWIIEKATEIGVSEIVPIISDRSEKKGLNMERANKIIKEASEQSGRVKLTRLNEPTELEELLKSIRLDSPVNTEARRVKIGDEEKIKYLLMDPKGEMKFGSLASKFQGARKIGVFVGPEGGWTDRELQLFRLKKIPIYSFGEQVLRAETAAIAVASMLLLG